MKHVSLGGLDVSRIGLGAMTMAGTYTSGGGLDDAESIRTIHRALELGVTHIDTAEIYGPFHSEEIVGRAIKDRRDQMVAATKFGLVSHAGSAPTTSTCTTSIASTAARQSRTQSARWPNWSPRARSATSGCPRPAPPRSAAPTPCIRLPPCRPSTPRGPATARAGGG